MHRRCGLTRACSCRGVSPPGGPSVRVDADSPSNADPVRPAYLAATAVLVALNSQCCTHLAGGRVARPSGCKIAR
jgi:hypothetical protein